MQCFWLSYECPVLVAERSSAAIAMLVALGGYLDLSETSKRFLSPTKKDSFVPLPTLD
jgi:hypothetical protein